MKKGSVKRSQFQFFSITDATTKTALVEGDEAYITVMTSSNPASIRRQIGRDTAKAIAANGGLASVTSYLPEWEIVDFSFGKVPLDVPVASGSYLSNIAPTSTVGNVGYVERIRNADVGFKEYVDIKASNTTYPLNVCIETVHYVPADTISA
ncbi:hypothetical protein GO755_32905 [Spirosoma sp. HMF4905]|uniref:Uncharacterized protein n=1 Tax=Spirosoma arboris TaxID=2682092 RepID=A0A7K1SM44_9BACT|nr:hypothetical protein [Spirosoma arboris]MVM34875.1 hypothetical protein [Spirosoma arboris]